jgi:hypothetical protein
VRLFPNCSLGNFCLQSARRYPAHICEFLVEGRWDRTRPLGRRGQWKDGEEPIEHRVDLLGRDQRDVVTRADD